MENKASKIDKVVPKWVYLFFVPVLITLYETFTNPITPEWAMIMMKCSLIAFAIVSTYYILKVKGYWTIAIIWWLVLTAIFPLWTWF